MDLFKHSMKMIKIFDIYLIKDLTFDCNLRPMDVCIRIGWLVYTYICERRLFFGLR